MHLKPPVFGRFFVNEPEIKMKNMLDTFKLINGYEISCIGFGTWQINGDDAAEKAVMNAIGAGYRHIDTAAVYGNETGVGSAAKNAA